MSTVNIDGKKCILVNSERVEEDGKKYVQMTYKAIKSGEEILMRVEYKEPGE